MGRIAVAVAGLVGVGLSVWLIVRQWDSVREEPADLSPDASRWDRLRQTTGRATGMIVGALVAGVLVLGLGGRLMMRVLAATSPEAAQGRVTDAEEIVGEVTLGGTMGFVLGVGAFGGMFALAMFALLRRWLPSRSVLAGMIAAGIGAGLLARPSGLVDPDNRDFVILDPTWLAVLLALGLIVLFGLLLGVLVDSWGPRWPRPSITVLGISGLLPLLIFIMAPPVPLLIAAAIVFGAFAAPALSGLRDWGRLDAVGQVALVGLAILGTAWTVLAGAEILTL